MNYSKLGGVLQPNVATTLMCQKAWFCNTFFPPTLLLSCLVMPAIRRQSAWDKDNILPLKKCKSALKCNYYQHFFHGVHWALNGEV